MADARETTTELGTLIELSHEAGARAAIASWRGGMVVQLRLGGRELLYLDPETMLDEPQSVRGGIPVLFPSPGRLSGGGWALRGLRGSMNQHGFARDLPWSVHSIEPSDGSVTLRLCASELTRAAYPWSFSACLVYRLRASCLRVELRVTNEDRAPMPFGYGLHPYFAVRDQDKSLITISTPARRAWDNVAKQEVALNGRIDLTASEVDLYLLDHGLSSASLELPGGPAVALRGSPEFTQWVVWTLGGRDFVCVEPWTCSANALNSGQSLLEVEPGGCYSLWLEIETGERR